MCGGRVGSLLHEDMGVEQPVQDQLKGQSAVVWQVRPGAAVMCASRGHAVGIAGDRFVDWTAAHC